MFNFGSKRGYNTNSGLLYIKQGNTLLTPSIQLPTYYCSKPYYENKENTAAFLLYSRNNVKNQEQTREIDNNNINRLKLSKDIAQKGGTETMKDFQTI